MQESEKGTFVVVFNPGLNAYLVSSDVVQCFQSYLFMLRLGEELRCWRGCVA